MRDNKQYLIVGLFVIVTATILITVWMWFASHNRKSYNTFLAVFTESVDGVTTNSVVKYNGVEVGKVKAIELDPQDPHNIRVYLNVLQNVALNKQTYATLKAQGITGMFYISLTVPPSAKGGDNIKPHNEEPYPVIATKTSLLSSLTEQANSIAGNINDVSSEVKVLLNEKNIQHVTNILAGLDTVSTTLANRSNEINDSIKTMALILHNVKRNSENLNATFAEIKELTQVLNETTENANSLITNVQNNTLQNVNSVLLPNLNNTIAHLNQSSYQLEQLLKLLNQNPSALIRGKTAPVLGPGE